MCYDKHYLFFFETKFQHVNLEQSLNLYDFVVSNGEIFENYMKMLVKKPNLRCLYLKEIVGTTPNYILETSFLFLLIL